MNTDKLEALLHAIEKGSLTAAADFLHYTPSAVSRSIESVEQELGLSLLIRSRTGIKMTAACEELLPEIRQLLENERILREHAALITAGASGTIRIGICYPALYPWVSSMMAGFKLRFHDIHYIIRHGYSSELLDQVAEHEIDLCLISRLDTSCRWITLFDDELVAVIPADHPFAKSDSVPIQIFEQEQYLELHSDKETDNSRALKACSVHPLNSLPLDDSSAMYAMVEAGLGIGMENRINTLNHTGSFVTKPLDPPQIIQIGIAYYDGILPVARNFIEYLTESGEILAGSLR